VTTRQPTPGSGRPLDLGPNSEGVRSVLDRAATLTPAEWRRLGEVASWRWWPLTLPVGGASAGPRATAMVRARGAGRGDAVRWIEAQAAALAGTVAGRGVGLGRRAVANACLAALTRDLVPEDVFDSLSGPWREVTHR
jgi:hypothetical protein